MYFCMYVAVHHPRAHRAINTHVQGIVLVYILYAGAYPGFIRGISCSRARSVRLQKFVTTHTFLPRLLINDLLKRVELLVFRGILAQKYIKNTRGTAIG